MSVERAKVELAAVKREIDTLHKRLNDAVERETKLKHYVELTNEFEKEPSEDNLRARRGSKVDAVITRVTEILQGKNRPIPTRELLKILEDEGYQIGGQNPVGNLSGFLSKSTHLQSNRKYGWGLIDWDVSDISVEFSKNPGQFSDPLNNFDKDYANTSHHGDSNNRPEIIDDLDDDIPF